MLQKPMIFASCLMAAFSTSWLVAPTLANERYRERPPVVVSPDLNAPWVMQLQGARSGEPRVHYAPQVQRSQQIKPRSASAATQNAPRQRQLATGAPQIQRQPQYRQQPQGQLRQHAAPRQPQQMAVLNKPNQPKRPQIAPQFLPQIVAYPSKEKPGTIVIDTAKRFLYLVMKDGKARRYGIGVGKPGFELAGTHMVTRKAEWPDWRPPQEMIKREAKKGHYLPTHMAGGPSNPMGARAMYLGSTLYRIHGTNAPWTIGRNDSSGCIRMRNEDVTDLYERVTTGTKVIVS